MVDGMKIGFLGLCSFGMEYLKILIEEGYRIEFATTKRKAAAHITELEKECADLCGLHEIDYLGAVDVNDSRMIQRAARVDAVIMGGYDAIVKTPFIKAARCNIFNTHLGLIPHNRGCYPVVWSLMGDDNAGYSTYQVTSSIDEGPILFQEDIPIYKNDTAKMLYDRLCERAVNTFPIVLEKIAHGKWKEITPGCRHSSYHVEGMPNDRWISWHWQGEFISRFCRALTFPPYPGPRTRRMKDAVEIQFEFKRFTQMEHLAAPGTVVDRKGALIQVACKNGWIAGSLFPGGTDICLEPGTVLESITGGRNPIAVDYPLDKYCCQKNQKLD